VVSVHGSEAGVCDAATRAIEAAFADVPRARGLVLAVLGRGPGPGLRPHAATLRACMQVAEAREMPTRGCLLGRVGSELVEAFARERIPRVEDREPLVCRWPDLERTVTIPRGWIGRHLCLVVPCVGAIAPRRGPVAAGLAALADAIGVRDAEHPVAGGPAVGEIAARVVAGTFGGITILVDADVAVVRARSGGGRPRLVPAHRIFTAHRVPAPAAWLLALARGFDGWLAHRTSSAELRDPLRNQLRFGGPLADKPWSAAAGEPLPANSSWTPPAPRRRAAASAGPRPR
jgi:hypothetical protein